MTGVQTCALPISVAALAPAQRSFRVDAFGLPLGQSYAAADRTVRKTLDPLASEPPLRGEFFRRLGVGGSFVQLASIDRLRLHFRLRSGRLPATCEPQRCEVLQLGGGPRSEWSAPGLHFARVGVGDEAGQTPFGDSLAAVRSPNGESATVLVAKRRRLLLSCSSATSL